MGTVTSSEPTAHAQLAGTTADLVTIGVLVSGRYGAIEVYNRSETQDLWFTYALQDNTPATAAAEADGAWFVPPDSSFSLPLTDDNATQVRVSVVGNGNLYSVHGIPQ